MQKQIGRPAGAGCHQASEPGWQIIGLERLSGLSANQQQGGETGNWLTLRLRPRTNDAPMGRISHSAIGVNAFGCVVLHLA
jgi:hypothetical protein